MSETRTCSRCGQSKPPEDFYDRGNRYWCRPCARSYVLDWRKKNPLKHKAQRALQGAMRRGEIVRPDKCERCGTKTYACAHHEDYRKPLEIVWLCDSCHARRHWELKAAKANGKKGGRPRKKETRQ